MSGPSSRGRFALAVVLFAVGSVRADDLEARIAPLADAHKGTVAVAVRHLVTGESYYRNADAVLPTASLIKLPILVETYWQAAEGKVNLADPVTLTADDKVPGSGILTTHFSPGATFPLRDAARLMIAYSDNTATNLVLDKIGIPSTNVRMAKLGLPETRINAKVFRGSVTSVDPERTKKYGLGSTTARETVELLARLQAGRLVSPAAGREMLGHLKACGDDDGFRRLLPPGVVVAHKSGAVTEARTEAGILYLPSGPVAVCVLTAGNDDKRWMKDNAGNLLRANVAKAVADHFAAPRPPTIDTKKLAEIDAAVQAGLDRGDYPGAVVAVVHADAVVYRQAFGRRAVRPEAESMTADTIFDLASLTKPVATAAAVMQLVERGKLNLSDPVAKHWPAFAANGKEAVTVEHCLLHTSGLTADNAIGDYADGREKALERIAGLKLEAPQGTRFRYSDVGFIVLGELVARVGGKPVDEFAAANVFKPLKTTDTGFRPVADRLDRVAPTGQRDGKVIRGEVHDPRAFRLGGAAGHAGLFGTADDLARYCRMLLRGGELDGVRVLSPESVARLTTGLEVPPDPAAKPFGRPLLRSLGWDVDTGFTGQRGDAFRPGTGYGHTGFTGTSVWLDPASRTAVIVLTNRVHPDDKGKVADLRRRVGTIVGEAVAAGK